MTHFLVFLLTFLLPLQSFADTTLVASHLKAGGKINITTAPGASVNLLAAKNTEYESHTKSSKSVMWQSQKGHGHTSETNQMNTIESTSLNIDTDHINVDVAKPTTPTPAADQSTIGSAISQVIQASETANAPPPNVQDIINSAAAQPGMEYLNQLKSDPRVNWNTVNNAYEEWDYKAQGLTQEGAAIIAIAVTIATMGAGAGAGAGVMAASQAGIALTGASAAAANAAMAALASQAAVTLVNNRGNIGKTFKDMATEETVKNLAVAALSAGATSGMTTALGATSNVAKSAINASSSAAAQSIVNGEDFGDALVTQLKFAGANIAQGVLSQQIGNWYRTTLTDASGHIDPNYDSTQLLQSAAHKLMHGLVGCATGSLAGSCAGGAAGAVTAETVAELLAYDDIQRLGKNPNLSQTEVNDILGHIQGNDAMVARLSGVAAGLMTGDGAEGVTVANQSAVTATENNWIPLALALASLAGSAVYTHEVGEGDFGKGLETIGKGDDPLSEAVSSGVEKGVTLAYENYPEATKATLAVLEGVNGTIDATVTYVDDATGKVVSSSWNSLSETTQNQLIGAGKVLSVTLPAGSVGKIAELKNLSRVEGAVGKYSGIAPAAGKIADKADISGLPLLRQNYIREVWALEEKGKQLLVSGLPEEQVARILYSDRRTLGIIYKDITPPDMLESIRARNLATYKDELGPSIEFMRDEGKSWNDIIKSASKPGPNFDFRNN